MTHPNTTLSTTRLEEAMTVLYCLIDDAYTLLDPEGGGRYSSLKRLSDSIRRLEVPLGRGRRGRGGTRSMSMARTCTCFAPPTECPSPVS
jgi:hypothetical protein